MKRTPYGVFFLKETQEGKWQIMFESQDSTYESFTDPKEYTNKNVAYRALNTQVANQFMRYTLITGKRSLYLRPDVIQAIKRATPPSGDVNDWLKGVIVAHQKRRSAGTHLSEEEKMVLLRWKQLKRTQKDAMRLLHGRDWIYQTLKQMKEDTAQ